MVDAMLEWFRLRNCILPRDSEATKHRIMLKEKPPETIPETARPVETTTGAAIRAPDCAREIRAPDCAWEILTSELTHKFEL
jgi:hypothetical protein